MSAGTTDRWTYRDAVRTALADAMRADDRVVLLGEDVGAAGGVFKATNGLLEEFGPSRVRDTPISEQAIVGSAIGAAMLGFRPVVEIMFADFAAVCFDQIVNQLAKHRFLTGGQVRLPVTIRLANGAGTGFGAQHSQAVENWFIGQPGIKVCVPGSAANTYALLRAAIEDPDPVLVFEHKALYGQREDRADPTTTAIGQAAIARAGADVTVVAAQLALYRSLRAAESLSPDVSVEVIDLGTIRPLDVTTVLRSVAKTGRLVCVQEGDPSGGWGQALIASVAEQGFEHLDVPPTLIASDTTPVPYASTLEQGWIPDQEKIEQAIRRLIEI